MTNGLGLFLAFYILVGQPALLGRMLDNCSLYQLAGLNAGIFLIAWIISAIAKSGNKKALAENNDNTVKVAKKSEEKVSRIENDEGVAIVEVQKKEEIVVETKAEEQNENIEELPQNTEEKLEERDEEEKTARPMRENVSIPKIVQPITGYAPIQKRKKEVKRGQRIVLLITLALAIVIAWTLWEFLGNRGVAIALILGWILYLVIGKLFDIAGFYNAKKLFTNWLYIILILAGIGYGVYATQNDNSIDLIKDRVISYVQNLFKSEEENDDSNINEGEDVIYVFEGTGEVITDTGDNMDILDEEGATENGIETTEIDTGVVENIQPEVEVQPEIAVEENAPALSPEEAKKQVTMGEAIKSLLAGATLSTKTNTTFKYVSKSNELYPYFKTAQEKGMIGTDTDPSKIVSCETYITMKGLFEGRNVGNYAKGEIKSVYWNKASELGKLNGCIKGAYVTRGNL